MPEGHIPDDLLLEHASGATSQSERAGIEAHLEHCRECAIKLDDYQTIAAALRDTETWWLADAMDGDGRNQLHDLVARWESEDAQAKELVGAYLTSAYRFAYANITKKRRYYTGGVVRLLCDTARAQLHQEPEFSLDLSDAACLIADSLPDNYYPAATVNHLRGNAWKDYSTACRYLGKLDESLDALVRAERAYRRLSDPEIQLATVTLCRAIVRWQQERYGEALQLAQSAAQRFISRRDDTRYFEALECEAIIRHDLGEVHSVREILTRTFELAETLGDPEMKARAAKNLAAAHRDAGDIGSASKFFLIALQLYEGLGQRAMVVHTRWSIAKLALVAGNAHDAAEQLPRIVTDLKQLGMLKNAADAQLDLAEALLLLERFGDVEVLAMQLIDHYRGAKMLTGALTAMVFLREATRNRTAKPRDIEHVRRYLEAVERAPTLPFAPPPDD
jgi:tetratricopeptide (TPR) repeat protein